MNNEVYNFIDSELNSLVDRFISNLNGFLRKSELQKILDEYEISYEVFKYQQWLEENNYAAEVDDVEMAIIAREFKKLVNKKFES